MPSTWPLRVDWASSSPQLARPTDEAEWPARALAGPGLRALGRSRYRLDGIAWEGGQADLWGATDQATGQPLVIKTLPHHVRGSSGQLTALRLVREARILRALTGRAGIMPLRDWGEAHLWDGPTGTPPGPDDARYPWLALPYFPHRRLGEVLRTAGPFPPAAAAALGLELARSLAQVHGAGVVHRDVSPGNVLLIPRGLVLCDFGAAWMPRDVDDRLERASSELSVAGRPRTLGWSAPEVMTWGEGGDPPDRHPASDVFCWGLFVYAAMAGRHPWSTGDLGSVHLTAHDASRMLAQARRERVPDTVPRTLRSLVEASLDPRPGARPSAGEIAAELAGVRSGYRPPRTAPAVRRRRSTIAAALGGALVVAVAATTFLVRTGTPPPAPAPATPVCPTPSAAAPPGPAQPASSDRIEWADQPAFAAGGRTLYEQSFADPASGWPTPISATVGATIRDCAYVVHPAAKGDYAYVAAPATDEARVSDEVVTATATLRSGQGFWSVWCRGTDAGASNAYYFEISHTAAVRILVLDGSPNGGGTGWHHLDGVAVDQPTTIQARCADVPDAPVELVMAVNGRQVLSFRPTTALLGPGYAGIGSLTFSDVDGPTAQEAFTRVAISQYG